MGLIHGCSEHSLNICRANPLDLEICLVFSLFNSSNTIEAVIVTSSNLGTKTSDSIDGKLAKFASVKTLAKCKFNNLTS